MKDTHKAKPPPPSQNSMSEPKTVGEDNSCGSIFLYFLTHKSALSQEEKSHSPKGITTNSGVCKQAVCPTIQYLPPASKRWPHPGIDEACKQYAQKIKLHMHSLGATPIFAFGTLLLLAANTINGDPGTKNKMDKTSDLNSRDVLN